MNACMYACVPGGEVLSMRVELSRMLFVDEGSVYGWMDGSVVCGFLVVCFVPHTTWSRVGGFLCCAPLGLFAPVMDLWAYSD